MKNSNHNLELGCERIKSYTKIPPSFPHMKRPPNPLNPIAFKVLNKTWISVSQGSEVNFKINAKNQYEEALLKVISDVLEVILLK